MARNIPLIDTMPNQETTIKEHTEHSDSVNPRTNRCQRHRKLRLAALALAATWIPFSGQAEIQEEDGHDGVVGPGVVEDCEPPVESDVAVAEGAGKVLSELAFLKKVTSTEA